MIASPPLPPWPSHWRRRLFAAAALSLLASRAKPLVNKRLSERVESYRFALERLVIMTPSQEAVEVEDALNRL